MTSELERQADELLLRDAQERTKAAERQPWSVSPRPEREAQLAANGLVDEELRAHAAELLRRRDLRGELSRLLESGDAEAFERLIAKHKKVLFGGAPVRHVTLEAWRFGHLAKAAVRLDKMKAADVTLFLESPATRFLRELTLGFVDDGDDAVEKLRRGKRRVEDACNFVRVAPCRDSLERVLVRSIDPHGQPPGLLAEKHRLPPTAVRPLKRLREFLLVFDSE